jgi:lipoprotein signal peptidase
MSPTAGAPEPTTMSPTQGPIERGRERRDVLRWAGFTCLLVAVDQLSKLVVRATLSPGSTLPLLDDILRITFVPNYRGFSWFVPVPPEWVKTPFLLLRLLIFLMAFPVYEFYRRSGQGSRWAWVALIGISAGTMGDALDDLFFPYTTDFIQVCQSPSANFADTLSFVGVGALLVEVALRWRREKPRWRGFRHHLAEATHMRRAFFAFLWHYFGRTR